MERLRAVVAHELPHLVHAHGWLARLVRREVPSAVPGARIDRAAPRALP